MITKNQAKIADGGTLHQLKQLAIYLDRCPFNVSIQSLILPEVGDVSRHIKDNHHGLGYDEVIVTFDPHHGLFTLFSYVLSRDSGQRYNEFRSNIPAYFELTDAFLKYMTKEALKQEDDALAFEEAEAREHLLEQRLRMKLRNIIV
jgi:hypothetical protein